MAAFDPVWETLTLREQARVLRLLVQRVDYDGDKGTVSVTFHPTGIETLSREMAAEVAGTRVCWPRKEPSCNDLRILHP
jgi:site-specific DNA recombinase